MPTRDIYILTMLFEMYFLLQELWVGAYISGPVVESTNHTVFYWKRMVTVQL